MKIFLASILALAAAGLGAYVYVSSQTVQQDGLPMQKEWLSCGQNEDCDIVYSGCGQRTPSNKNSIDEVTRDAYAKFGDPREISCISPPNAPVFSYTASCVSGSCTVVTTPKE